MVKAVGKIEITIERPNGNIEVIDATNMLRGFLSAGIFEKMQKDTAAAGRGNVLSATVTVKKNNGLELARRFNKVNNEGGEGYIPDAEYFAALPEYKEWEEIVRF